MRVMQVAPKIPLGLGEELMWGLDNLTGGDQQGHTGNHKIPQQASGPEQQKRLLLPPWLFVLSRKKDLQNSCPCLGRPAETQDSSITSEGSLSQETKEGPFLFLTPLQTPERITIQ